MEDNKKLLERALSDHGRAESKAKSTTAKKTNGKEKQGEVALFDGVTAQSGTDGRWGRIARYGECDKSGAKRMVKIEKKRDLGFLNSGWLGK